MPQARLHLASRFLTLTRRVIFTALCVPGFLVLQEIPAQSAMVLDQSFTSGNDLAEAINEACRFVAQTFTAGRTGTLSGINIEVASTTALNTFPLRVAIRRVSHGRPTSTVLGSVALMPHDAPLSRLIEFRRAIPVSAGVQYAIVVDYRGGPQNGPGQQLGWWNGSTGDMYPRGMLLAGGTCTGPTDRYWQPYPTYDVHFRTYVEPPAA